jgi:hypothetical protein
MTEYEQTLQDLLHKLKQYIDDGFAQHPNISILATQLCDELPEFFESHKDLEYHAHMVLNILKKIILRHGDKDILNQHIQELKAHHKNIDITQTEADLMIKVFAYLFDVTIEDKATVKQFTELVGFLCYKLINRGDILND